MRLTVPFVACLALALVAPSWAQQSAQPGTNPVLEKNLISSASSRHVLRRNNLKISYVATWSEMVLRNSDGIPEATISATSYLRDDVQDHTRRPVMFAFNGGPGASSSPLHFSILGPRRATEPDEKGIREFVDNAETLLDSTDLVLIDPVGTGFSRELRAGGGQAYWSPAGDSRATQTFIRDWLSENERAASPVYIVGESFGGYRVAAIAKDISDLNVAGLILISPGMDLSGEAGVSADQQFVFTLPSMAVAALVNSKVARSSANPVQFFEDAQAFAQSDYVTALQQGSALASSERQRIAEHMANLVGLPTATIVGGDLRLDTQDFLELLLPGKVVSRLDTRVSAPKPEQPLVAGRSKAADDPALKMGASNIKKSPWVRDYLRNEIGVRTDLDYIGLSLDVNFSWNWNSGSHKIEDNLRYLNPSHNLAELMSKRPALRLLLIGGLCDLATPWLYQRYSLTHAGVPLDRTRMVAFASGHTVYEGDAMRRQVSQELHDFITSTSNAKAEQ